MTSTPQLCLGTVQFGQSYGVTNQGGKVPETEVRQILKMAAESGVNLFDTAQAYGSAEIVLGQCWPTTDSPRRIISKLAARVDPTNWEDSFNTSLQRLQVSKLDGFLLHRAADLLEPNGEALLDWLEGLRKRELVRRIGVSIYDGSELEYLPLNRIQLVQLPLSVYDQRLILDGTISKLQQLGIAVHVRSVFLQGLLLQSPNDWPNHYSTSFLNHHKSWLNYIQQNKVSPATAALNFVRSCEGIEAILVGVTSLSEFSELIISWNRSVKSSLNWQVKDWAWNASSEADPRSWEAH